MGKKEKITVASYTRLILSFSTWRYNLNWCNKFTVHAKISLVELQSTRIYIFRVVWYIFPYFWKSFDIGNMCNKSFASVPLNDISSDKIYFNGYVSNSCDQLIEKTFLIVLQWTFYTNNLKIYDPRWKDKAFSKWLNPSSTAKNEN